MHSILITHRDRNVHLALCLWSIERSAATTGQSDWEVIVADGGSKSVPRGDGGRIRVVEDPRPREAFCKPRLQNLAIAAARGELLTFLDADALVGAWWLEGISLLERDPGLVRLCYRVRYLPEEVLPTLLVGDPAPLVDDLFSRYEQYERGYEAYGRPEHSYPPGADTPPTAEAWGNSQFSVRRDVLADLRPDEGYVGRDFEDLDFNCAFFRRYGNSYRGRILTDAAHAMFHLRHGYDPRWRTRDFTAANAVRFRAKSAVAAVAAAAAAPIFGHMT